MSFDFNQRLTLSLSYLHSLLSKRLCRCERDRLPDRPHCAEWPWGPRSHHSRCCSDRHTERSQGGTANTPFALCPQRTSRDSRSHTDPRGESDSPHSLHTQEQLSALHGGTIYYNSGKVEKNARGGKVLSLPGTEFKKWKYMNEI